jgi:hyaluronoglucosaminidase
MYDPGSWPTITINRDGEVIHKNGGLPQKGNLTVHLSKLEDRINEFIPNKTFDGLAVIDFEHWRPIFRQNFYGHLTVYRNMTLREIKQKHPTWTRDQIEAQARSVFETAAIYFVNRTMLRAKKLRPNAKWGYYGFPHCFNRYRTLSDIDRCPEQVEQENNKLMSMFHNAIYPSIYINQNQTDEHLTKYVMGKMYETNRILKQLTGGGADVLKLPFIRYQYTDTMNFMKEVCV